MSAVHVRHIRCLRSRQRMCLCRVLSVSVLGGIATRAYSDYLFGSRLAGARW